MTADQIEAQIRAKEAEIDNLTLALREEMNRPAEVAAPANGEPLHPDLNFGRFDYSRLDLAKLPSDLAGSLIGVALIMNRMEPEIRQYLDQG